MPLQNRVTPLSELIAHPARGLVYGNRGCLHNAHGEIVRFAATRRWIACRLRFKDWHRHPLRQPGRFTELFFLDEATAFAAGHRPCALCRRADYNAANPSRVTTTVSPGGFGADEWDRALQAERMDGSRRRLHPAAMKDLPDGAMIIHSDAPHLVLGDAVRRWSPAGYGPPQTSPTGRVALLTPPSFVDLLRADWRPAVPLISLECPPSRPPT